jgi:hypothetical protein
MAQRLHAMANGSAVEFDSILRSFNDEQLMQPERWQAGDAAAAANTIQKR